MNWQQEQEQFWRWINQPQDLQGQADRIAELFAPHRHLSQAQALSIYNNAYHQRLIDVSSALFPILFNTLGRDIYTRLWIGYMGKYPPRHGAIHRVGEHLGDYVSTHEQFRNLPAVADIVHLEGLLISLFDAVDEVPYALAELQALAPEDWPTLRLQGKQDWALLHSGFDLEKYWRLMQDFIAMGGEPGAAGFGVELWAIGEGHRGHGPLPQGNGRTYLVYRTRYRMHFQAIGPELTLFLQSVRNGDNFAQICEHLACGFPTQDIPPLSLKLLLRAIDLELVCAGHATANAG